jgi:hypothetical protein
VVGVKAFMADWEGKKKLEEAKDQDGSLKKS